MTEIIEMPNGWGKTWNLVRIMLQRGNEDLIYVAPTRGQADNARQYAGQDAPRGRFLSAQEAYNLGGSRTRTFVVDEVDGVDVVRLPGEVLIATRTPDRLQIRHRHERGWH